MWTRIAYGLAVLALVVLVENSVGWTTLFEPWTHAAPQAICGALLLMLLTYLLRSARLFRYFHECREFAPCVRVFLLHNAFVNVLPMHTGEASFPVLMKRYFAIPPRRSISGLLWLRYLDMHALGLMALIALWLVAEWRWIPFVAVLWLMLPVVTVIAWSSCGRLLNRHDHPVWSRVGGALQALPKSPAVLAESWGWTAANWAIKIAAFAWILTIFAPIDYAASVFGAAGGELSGILPLKMPAGIGTYEAGIVAATTPLGVDLEHALAGGVNLHLFVLGMSIAGGLATLLLPRVRVVRESIVA